MMLLRSWWMSSIRENMNNNEQVYCNMLSMVHEIQPWLRYINQDERDTAIREWIPTFLRNCTLSMAQQKCSWLVDISFGKEILEYSFSNFGDKYFSKSGIVESVLSFMGQQCKKNPTSEETLKLFFKMAVYCTVAYGTATGDECIILAKLFSSLTSDCFNEVTLLNVRLLMEHYAISLVINHFDLYKNWPNPKFAQALSIKHVLTQLEVHLKEFNDTYVQTEPNLHPFLCDRISTLILSKYEEFISATEKYKTPIKLPVVGHILDLFTEDNLSANCKSDSIKHAEQITKVAVAAFTLLVITKQDTKDFLKNFMKYGKLQPRVITYFYRCLHKLFQPLYNSGRIAQAMETLQLCCDALWVRVSLSCGMGKSSENGVRGNFSSEDSIVNFVEEATENSALLLRLHQLHHANDIQCQKVEGKDPETCDLAPTIFSMVPSLERLKQPSCIILEQELHSYPKMQDRYPVFCKRMKKHIHTTILTMKSRQHVFDRCKDLIKCGMRLGSCGFARQLDCIVYICEAQTMLFNFDKDDDKLFNRIEYLNLMSDTCFSVALIRRLTSPREKEVLLNRS